MKPRHWIGLCALALLFAGCSQPGSDDTGSASTAAPGRLAGWYSVEKAFKDPQAQALARAAQDNNVAEVRRLMKDEHVNPDVLFSDDGARTPLVAWPVLTRSLAGLKAMLDNGANPNARDPKTKQECVGTFGCETFHVYDNAMVYAAKAEDPAYLQALLEHGGDPNTRNIDQESLLFGAYIWHNQWPNVQVLVEHGADVNATTQGATILGDYTREGDFKKAYWLLQRGANPKALDPSYKPRADEVVDYLMVDDIYWYPAKPDFIDAQRQCQHWLRDRGIGRPPMSKYYREMRKRVGAPTEEKDIPLL
ncbi:ankyrin repeat domain-containing protein [Rhodanobacter aciditrophus]|uniref:ankyrin repeat domain-containing protein n=1 Tax=Rhodanobacter aciditrophus TaxID=1623218 RepID=UPI003CEEBB24